MQPPSLLSSLSEITESQELVLEQPQPALPQVLLPLLLRGGDDDASDDARSSSSTRSLLRDPQPLSHRWPPALRGSPPPEPAPPQQMISVPPRQRELPPGQPGSPH
jgi:hypothetical protein